VTSPGEEKRAVVLPTVYPVGSSGVRLKSALRKRVGREGRKRQWRSTADRRLIAMSKVILIVAAAAMAVLPVFSIEPAEWRSGRYWYFVENIEVVEGEKSELLLWVSLPPNHRGQTLEMGPLYPEPEEVVIDSVNGNSIVLWRETGLQGKDGLTFHYDFRVLSEEVNAGVEPGLIVPYDKESEKYRIYTRSEPWIEVTGEVRKKALEIVGYETNPYYRAKMLFDWVTENMTYEYPEVTNRGADKSLKRLKGDCGEFSVVFVAMCRALGIPARTVTCVWFTGSGHQWAEVLLPPYGWVPADPSVAQGIKRQEMSGFGSGAEVRSFTESRGIPAADADYLFGNLYPQRLIVCVGNNIEVVSGKTGVRRTFRFLQPGGRAAYPPAVELRGLSEKTVHCGFYLFGADCREIGVAEQRADKELASAYFFAGVYDKAKEGFLRTLEDDPGDAMAWLNLGQILFHERDYSGAAEAFLQAIAGRAGSITPVIHAWAHNLLGNCYDVMHMRARAVDEYRRVIEMDVNFQGAVDTAEKYLNEPFRETDE
jgi:hypothetical protein